MNTCTSKSFTAYILIWFSNFRCCCCYSSFDWLGSDKFGECSLAENWERQAKCIYCLHSNKSNNKWHFNAVMFLLGTFSPLLAQIFFYAKIKSFLLLWVESCIWYWFIFLCNLITMQIIQQTILSFSVPSNVAKVVYFFKSCDSLHSLVWWLIWACTVVVYFIWGYRVEHSPVIEKKCSTFVPRISE